MDLALHFVEALAGEYLFDVEHVRLGRNRVDLRGAHQELHVVEVEHAVHLHAALGERGEIRQFGRGVRAIGDLHDDVQRLRGSGGLGGPQFAGNAVRGVVIADVLHVRVLGLEVQ
ncbi:hypothetical protein LVJ94_43055 [Pendulispora rubella]|uniref:Uncharacterized protein n=1 Tax=Pendulispora rubella TaxID=2741070 RepID=A0ABZ2L4W7_9BACT